MTQPPPYDDGFFAPKSSGIATPATSTWPQPTGWPSPPPGRQPAPQPQRASRGYRSPVVWIVGAIVIVIACFAGGVFTVQTKSKASGALDPGCSATAPSGASNAARQFLAATAAADVGWRKVGQSITAENNVVHRDDLAAQVTADSGFLTSLAAINYPVVAQTDATSLQQLIRQYDEQLTIGYNQDGYLATHGDELFSLDNQRAITSGALRQDLGLGNTSCQVQRP
jgi:hypothetical protein